MRVHTACDDGSAISEQSERSLLDSDW